MEKTWKKKGVATGLVAILVNNVFADANNPFSDVNTLATNAQTAFNAVIAVVAGIAIVTLVIGVFIIDENNKARKAITNIAMYVLIGCLVAGAITYIKGKFSV